MLVSESSDMHQLRRRSAQKPQLDLIADRMPLEHCAALPFSYKMPSCYGHAKTIAKGDLGTMEHNGELGIPNVEFIVMPSKLGETNLGADCGGFYSAFYR